MTHRAARLAALVLLLSAGHAASMAPAGAGGGKDTEKSASTAAEEQRRDEALEAIGQGFSIPAADGAATKDGPQKKGSTKK